jgi:AraC-like DNA-binding protein
MPQIPSLSFDTDDLPPDQRFAAWRSAVPHYRLTLPSNVPPEHFYCRAKSWFLGDFTISRSALPALHWSRSRGQIESDGVDTYNFVLLSHGGWIGTAGKNEFTLGSGQLCCVDLSQPFEGDAMESDSLAIAFARPTIDRLLRVEPDLHGRVFFGPSGMLLIDYLTALERQLPHLEQDDVPSIGRAVLSQFAAMIEITAQPRSGDAIAPSLRHRARRHIERHLADRHLTPARLAEELHVTRSTLYRCFKPIGGIAAYIQRRRLETVRILLGHADEQRSVAELAETFGFANASHLTSAFRKAYGLTPREHRLNARPVDMVETQHLSPTNMFRAWTRKLQGNFTR